ncbi:MAG: Ig-like domain-containing protein [Armatimonadota bacterium]
MMIFLAAMLAFAAPVNIEPVPDSSVSDTVEIRVTTETPMNSVEFLIDGKSVGFDSSTPYIYKWDTVAGDEGAHTVTLVMTDEKYQVERKEINYVVDNGLGQGLDYWVKEAKSQMSTSNRKSLNAAAKRAYKIDPKSAVANALMAIATLRMGDIPKAKPYVVMAAAQPMNKELLSVLNTYWVEYAFSDGIDEVEQYSTLKTAITTNKTFLESELVRVEKGNNALEVASANLALNRFEKAATEYIRAGKKENTGDRNMDAALCWLRAGRWHDAQLLVNLTKSIDPTNPRLALVESAIKSCMGNGADDIASLNSMTNLAVPIANLKRYVQIDISLRLSRNPAECLSLLEGAAKGGDTSALLYYYTMVAKTEQREYPDAEEAIQKALREDIMFFDVYAQRGFTEIALGNNEIAAKWFELADFARQDDPWVLAAKAYLSRDNKQALDYAKRAVDGLPSIPWPLIVQAFVTNRAGVDDPKLQDAANEMMEKARNLDGRNFDMVLVRSQVETSLIMRRYGRKQPLPTQY